MRFKAKLLPDQLSLLHAIVAPISKLQDAHRNYAVLYLDEEYIRVSFKNSESGITCFVELSQRDLLIPCQQLPGRLHFAVVLQNYLGTKDSLFERDVIK